MEIKWSVVASVFCSFLLFSDAQTAMATKARFGTAQDKLLPSNSHHEQDILDEAGNSAYAAITDSDSIARSMGRALAKHSGKSPAVKKELAVADSFDGVVPAPPALVLIPTAEGYYMYDSILGEPQRYRR